MAMMGMPAALPMTDDHTFFTGNITIDKVLGDSGTVSLNAAIMMFGGEFKRWDNFWFVSAGYFMPEPLGIGKFRFSLRYQRGLDSAEDAEASSIIHGQVSYNVAAWFARFQLGYRRMEVFQRATTTAGARLDVGNQIYLGVTLA